MGFQTTDDACISRLDEWSEIGAETLDFDMGDTLVYHWDWVLQYRGNGSNIQLAIFKDGQDLSDKEESKVLNMAAYNWLPFLSAEPSLSPHGLGS